MKDGCTQSCGTCAEECADRKEEQADFMARLHAMSSVKKVIGIVSGKGGVGKSLVTSLLAVNMARKGYHCAILDADITGPSIPKAFGLKGQVGGTEQGIMPLTSATGIDVMSINLLMENETDPVIWRGPIIGNVVKQFWTDVIWKNIDFMFIDMPPGTGDVPLTVFQSLPVDGIVIVTSPQELVSMIVAKAVNMEKKLERWQRIAEEAAKQSGRGIIPQVRYEADFVAVLNDALHTDLPLFMYETGERETIRDAIEHTAQPIASAAIITGPEGGFAEFEADMARKLGMHICSMGERILRCETAPVVALTALMYGTGNL